MESTIIGDKIARARKRCNLSQAQLGEQLFISPQAVGKWERGESMPDIVTLNKLAKILGVELNYFSGKSESPGNDAGSLMANTADSIRDKPEEDHHPVAAQDRQLLTSFNGSALAETDFAGVSATKREFYGSDLHGANFAGADLTGSSFSGSDMRESNFEETNLTDCTFSADNLSGAKFNKTMLVRTEFSSSELALARFSGAKFVDVKFNTTDLRKTVFERCSFHGVDFKSSDLGGLCLDGLTFIGVKFDNAALKEASFKGTTLKNVSFRPTFTLTNRYFKSLKTINFEGAMMDKLTYAALKGMGVDLSKVTII